MKAIAAARKGINMHSGEYTNIEFMICTTARMMEDKKTVFVGFGIPQLAGILAQKLYTPNICQIYEYGAIAPKVATPFKRNMMADARNSYRACAWYNMNTVMAQASLGLIDYGILGAAQVDIHGNLNSTFIGKKYERPDTRLPGSGGGNEVASYCWKTIIALEHEKRRFPRKLDFMTSPGFLDGSRNAREKAGLPADTGPYRVITSMAIFDFDNSTRKMRIIATAPSVGVPDVLDNMQFEPLVGKNIRKLTPPREVELKILRNEIDPDRVIIGKL